MEPCGNVECDDAAVWLCSLPGQAIRLCTDHAQELKTIARAKSLDFTRVPLTRRPPLRAIKGEG